MLLFDTGKKLEKAFTKEQFDALVDMLEKRDDKLATSGELAAVKTELKGDIAAVRTELKADIAEVRTELKADIAEVRTELKADIAAVRTELKDVRTELIEKISASQHETLKWVMGMFIAQTGVLVALYAIMR